MAQSKSHSAPVKFKMSALTTLYDLLLSLDSDYGDCEIDIIAALNHQENLTKSNYLKKKKNAQRIYPKR